MSTATQSPSRNGHSKRATQLQLHFQTLAQRVHAAFSGQPHTLGITSCQSGEGVSTVAANLAAVSVDVYGGRVLLIDANLKRPALASTLAVRETPGLVDALAGNASASDCIVETDREGLFVMPAGTKTNRASHLGRQAGALLFDSLRADYQLVVVDLPPSGELDDRLLASQLLDGYLLVVESERVRQQVAQRVQEDFQRASARLIGVVLNKRDFHIPEWLYKKL